MIDESQAKRYCYEELSLIENYEQAVADQTQTWDVHHRNETVMNCGPKQLIAVGAYYDRPARELVFLTRAEHSRLHMGGRPPWNKGKVLSEETRRRMSEALKGRHHSEETKRKLSEMNKGKTLSEETRRRISEGQRGRRHSEETRRRISEALKGRHHSEETRRRMSEAKKGERNNNFGRHHSEETRRRISEAMRRFRKK